MRREKNTASNNASHEDHTDTTPPDKRGNRFVGGMKKVGFTVWLSVMIIGGALAFIVALFLV